MALQASGQIKFSEIATEFGASPPYLMSQFVRGGSKVPQAGANSSIPETASNMRFNHFYGAVNVIAYTASNGTNLNASTAFGSSWADNVPKELIIPSGVVIGSNSTGTAALILPSGMGGSLIIKNSGSIQGAGGAAGTSGAGGTGGTAILAQSSGITIQNNGSIYAGGGGGGRGGNGGQGSYTTAVRSLGNTISYRSTCDQSCISAYGAGHYCVGSCQDNEGSKRCNQAISTSNGCYRNVTSYTSGGTGGAGGRGRGYNQTSASGGGGSSGGTNAGTGGTGGAGGAFGASGSTGSTGANGNYTGGVNGSSGGLAGYYVSGIGNVTFSVTGTRAGRTQ